NAGVRELVARSLNVIAADRQAEMWPSAPPTLSTPAQLANTPQVPSVEVRDRISLRVNGHDHTGGSATDTLLDWVRDEAGLTGMKEGCAEGECGACTMLLDGVAVMSCLVTAAQADGCHVTTVEGLTSPLPRAFVNDFAVQCGFCIPGFLVAGERLLEENDDPDDDQIRLALSGNLCRCTGYYPIVEAVKSAAVEIRERS
ncbi:MAG: (2Fe-2S)-binding protein, partial [Acidimicrobiales bacterium]